jgi:hypothetical protein
MNLDEERKIINQKLILLKKQGVCYLNYIQLEREKKLSKKLRKWNLTFWKQRQKDLYMGR